MAVLRSRDNPRVKRWAKLSQEPSSTGCMSCGEKMMSVEPIKDKKGVVFEGLVCHKCKTVLWARKTS